MNVETAIGDIYEAALVPELWPSVLDTIAEMAGGVGTILIADDMHNLRWLNSTSLNGFMDDFIEGDWAKSNTRTPKLLGVDHAGFLVERDAYTEQEIEEDVMIRDFLRPRGFGWATATAFQMPTGDNVIFSIERRYADGPVPRDAVEQLDRIRPHLGRAAMLSARVGLDRGRATLDALTQLDVPAALIDGRLRLREANGALGRLIPRVVVDGREGVRLTTPAADALLRNALLGSGPRTPQSIPIPASESDPAIVAHVIPVRGAARDIFSESRFVLALTPALPSLDSAVSLLRGLFDLTPTEAKIVRGIADGDKPDVIAEKRGVAVGTVRTQLKGIFAKTGVRRQVDLVRLVSGLALVPDAGDQEPL